MEIVVAKSGGFCRGVRNAVDTALAVSPENTYIFGEIIHNPEVVKQITSRGIVMVERLEDVPENATLIIRSHGVGKDVYKKCQNRNIKILDCTCEFVRRTQNIITEQYEQGKTIVIVGERTHPEVVGLNGCCDNSAYIFSSEKDDFSILPNGVCCVVAQTTYAKDKYEQIIRGLKKLRGNKDVFFETICYTTAKRQSEAKELAKRCDAVLVIGGMNSSNTNKLYEICAKECDRVYRLSSAKEFSWETICDCKKVGIVTGASTPDSETQSILQTVKQKLKA